MVEENNLELSNIEPSREDGRITKEDIVKHLDQKETLKKIFRQRLKKLLKCQKYAKQLLLV